jgi:hypothetical protein
MLWLAASWPHCHRPSLRSLLGQSTDRRWACAGSSNSLSVWPTRVGHRRQRPEHFAHCACWRGHNDPCASVTATTLPRRSSRLQQRNRAGDIVRLRAHIATSPPRAISLRAGGRAGCRPLVHRSTFLGRSRHAGVHSTAISMFILVRGFALWQARSVGPATQLPWFDDSRRVLSDCFRNIALRLDNCGCSAMRPRSEGTVPVG